MVCLDVCFIVRHFKITDSPRFGRKDCSYLEELTGIRFIRTGVASLFNLRQGFIGSTIQFEFEDVDIEGSLDNAVHPSFTLLLFGIDGIATHHPHEQIERVMKVTFAFTLGFLAAHGVWNVGQEGSKQLAELFQVASLQCSYNIARPTSGILV